MSVQISSAKSKEVGLMGDNKNIIAMFTEPHKIKLIKSSTSATEEEYVYIEYLYCGICGGDYSVYRGYRQSYPVSLGHEFIAKVIAVGKSVTNIHPGQYVVSDFNYRCNECIFCKTNRSHLCIKNDVGLFSNRGFARYANVHSSYLVPIKPPEYLPRACLIEPLSCVIHACNTADIHQGMNILICGGGGIGMLFCFLLRSIYKEISITLAEENPNKSKLLCDHFLIQPYVSGSNNIYDLIVDCSNSITGLRFALDCAQRGNRVCVMSHLYGLDTTFVYEQACKKELRCSFPLRNGERNNLLLADEYLEQYWLKEYDDMLLVYDDVIAAFKEKEENQFCKQIVQSSSLCITEL